MIRLIPGADAKIKQLVFENSVRAYYLSACERYAKGYVNAFITDMQILTTKLGIMVASVASGPKTNISYCAQSINYLCSTVLDNPNLIQTFNEIGLNDKGNHGKHDIAGKLLLQEENPGWLYEVKMGATTIWERWNSILPDGSFVFFFHQIELQRQNHSGLGLADQTAILRHIFIPESG